MNEDIQKQLIKDHLIESFEGLEQFDDLLLELEEERSDKDTLNRIFRVIHTIKGTSGCLGLNKMEKVAHVGENLLSLLREGQIPPTPSVLSELFKLSDSLREMLTSMEHQENEGTTDYSKLLSRLELLQSNPDAEDPDSPARAVATPTQEPLPETEPVAESPAAEEAAESGFGLFSDHAEPPAPATVSPAAPSGNEELGESKSSVADSVIRVRVDQLDKLMNLVGELVLSRNQILQYSGNFQDDSLTAAAQRLNIITTELQENVMKARMQPIGNIWSKFPRIVRDLSHELGKKVQLTMEGKETELDRTIIECIKDPLTHIIRNAIDHGLEGPEQRSAAQKNETGKLLLKAFHEGGQVNIEITDDGRGINPARIKAKAVEKGIISASQAERIGDQEVVNLIFAPGFSTAETITNVSGRGIGMDVVKTNIEKIGGSIDVISEIGKRSTFRIKIPLTLAIIPALIVQSGKERFSIPQVSLLELVRLDEEQVKSDIETIYGSPVYRLRGNLLPLVYLHEVLEDSQHELNETGEKSISIVVLQADGKQFGLVVDKIHDTEEIVVKPLSKQLKHIKCFAGATIMGDGQVALILDVLGLAQQASIVTEGAEQKLNAARQDDSTGESDRQTYLLFNVHGEGRMALPLNSVARLEEIPRDHVETASAREVVQYRGQILPLIRISSHIPAASTSTFTEGDNTLPLQVVVHTRGEKSVGLVVDAISDIVEESISVTRKSTLPGILGSAVIQERVVDLLDIDGILRSAEPNFFEG